MIQYSYSPRNDFVLIRREVDATSKGGIGLPQSSREGQKFIVVTFGPEVGDLRTGDRVVICASAGEGFAYDVPREKDLFLVKQEFLGLVIGEEEVSDPEPEPSPMENLLQLWEDRGGES